MPNQQNMQEEVDTLAAESESPLRDVSIEESAEDLKELPEEETLAEELTSEQMEEADLQEDAAEILWEPPVKRRRFRHIVIFTVSILLTVAALFVLAMKLSAPEHGSQEETRRREFLEGEIVDTSRAEYGYEEMKSDLFALQAAYPDLLRVSSAGKSLDGRELYYADFGVQDAEKQIFISAGIHGREYLTPLLLMKMTEYYLVNYNTEDETGVAFADLAGDYRIRIIPMVNPDGIMISQQGLSAVKSESLKEQIRLVYESDCSKYESYRRYGSLEEYLKHWKANAAGVDLNRNFPIEYWGEMRTGVGQPSSQAYKGKSAGSEPETQAVISLVRELSNPVCVISIHSQGEILYWNCGQSGELLARNERLKEVLVGLTGYRSQSSFESPDATLDDWAALERGIPSVTIETGTGSCPLPIEQFAAIWEQTRNLWRCLVTYES